MRTGKAIDGFKNEISEVGGITLHYWIGGDPVGEPVVLMHGFLGTGYVWRHVAAELAKAGRAVLIPDMRGYGDSDKPTGTDGYDGLALAEECRALVRQIGFGNGRRLTLAAHDMGAPPALLWAAEHPDEIGTLLYLEEPVMLGGALENIIKYTPEAAERGSLWWWLMTLAPGAPEALVVGNEKAFLNWFYNIYATQKSALDAETVDEYLRTFTGVEGVLGAMGVYRAAFKTIAQTEPLATNKIETPVIAIGGEHSIGDFVGVMINMVAENVEAHTMKDCGHFLPEENPQAIAAHILKVSGGA